MAHDAVIEEDWGNIAVLRTRLQPLVGALRWFPSQFLTRNSWFDTSRISVHAPLERAYDYASWILLS